MEGSSVEYRKPPFKRTVALNARQVNSGQYCKAVVEKNRHESWVY